MKSNMMYFTHVPEGLCYEKLKDFPANKLKDVNMQQQYSITQFLSLMRMRFTLYVVEKMLLAIPREWFGIDNRPV